jgi:hypothetical protein
MAGTPKKYYSPTWTYLQVNFVAFETDFWHPLALMRRVPTATILAIPDILRRDRNFRRFPVARLALAMDNMGRGLV